MSTGPSPAIDESIAIWGHFRSPEMEERFRRQYRKRDVFQASVAFGVLIPLALLFIPADIHFVGLWTPMFWRLFVLRVVCATLSAIFLYAVQRLEGPAIDRLVLLSLAIAGPASFYIASTRPPQSITTFMLGGMFGLLLTFFIMPLPLRLQMLVTLVGFALDAYLVTVHYGVSDPVVRRASLLFYGASYLMGAAVSWRLHRLNREQFLALLRETHLRAEVEATLAENKVLRGILPICSYCKSVRTDEGYWQRVEEYVREHWQAEFSHGICPSCIELHYKREFESVRRSQTGAA